MPPLAHVKIPLYIPTLPVSRQSHAGTSYESKAQYRPRVYGDAPLSVKPSEDAPANARIIGRVIEPTGSVYQLRIGDVEIHDVGIDEILDYVSPECLEEYEHQQFEEEAELRRIAEIEAERQEAERRERQRHRAKLKGVVGYSDDRSELDVGASGEGSEAPAGRHGRARPSYKQLFKKFKERRRRRRNPVTGELMPLSDAEDDALELESSADDEPQATLSSLASSAPAEQHKRRRRKRDPLTGELLPLDILPQRVSSKKKRQRRRRHPLTGELMPIGWRYDPDMPPARQESNSVLAGTIPVSPAFDRLSISDEHPAKRARFDSELSSDLPQSDVESQEASEAMPAEQQLTISDVKTPPKPLLSASRGQLGVPAALQSAATSSAPETSPEPYHGTSLQRRLIAANTDIDNSEGHSAESEEGEFNIDAILDHKLSDPRTHAPEHGKKAVMLYLVKWEGYDEPSWEPVESFPDRSVVEHYHGMLKGRQISDERAEEANIDGASPKLVRSSKADSRTSLSLSAPAPKHSSPPQAMHDAQDSEEEVDDGSFEIEAIVAHHMSDPRTHRPEYGKHPVMLYQVKWKGYNNTTWEPIESFEDLSIVNDYRSQAGLPIRDA
ncbi:hypothetical protein BAUCODRAFT_145754 [Baudoinia panamericana UAMH 10762]|uniref:Chromo domain-containing protein n=1 Tax=Baudoinia panamericana (strain UAMH 10762) TaxID=717646 RepID=M2LVP0_BAUPA|nr:uncharacterized protein BAUCODRAFT_145754 [Baudoinia panamericana UAMH 10762]EMC98722.1 hypothetical protein BAUCODRAFT_145754 [Baudoinia panamericana UAMH 10762]